MPRRKRKYEEYLSLGVRPDGSRIRKFIASDSKADFERMKKAAIIEAEKIRNPSDISLYDYAASWVKIYKSKKSIASVNAYDNVIKKLSAFKYTQIKDVRPSDLQELINENWGHPETCRKIRMTLKQIFQQAIRDGIIYPRNIAEELTLPPTMPSERRFITDGEMENILQGNYKEQDKLYIEMLRNTGMRPSEALALQWGDIGDREIIVRRSFEFDGNVPKVKTTKTGQIRTIPITPEFAATLHQMPKSGLFIFSYGNEQPITKSVYRKMSARILKEINRVLGGTDKFNVLEGMTMYSFRHTYATNLYYNAVQPGIISTKKAAQIMGHSEEIFLKRYTHIDDNKEKMEELTAALFGKKGDQKETKPLKKVVGRP